MPDCLVAGLPDCRSCPIYLVAGVARFPIEPCRPQCAAHILVLQPIIATVIEPLRNEHHESRNQSAVGASSERWLAHLPRCEPPLTPWDQFPRHTRNHPAKLPLSASRHSHLTRGSGPADPPPARKRLTCERPLTLKARNQSPLPQSGRIPRLGASAHSHIPTTPAFPSPKCEPPLAHCRSHRSAQETDPSNQAALPICNNPGNAKCESPITHFSPAPKERELALTLTLESGSVDPPPARNPPKCEPPLAPKAGFWSHGASANWGIGLGVSRRSHPDREPDLPAPSPAGKPASV